MHEWWDVLKAGGSDLKAELYQRSLGEVVERFFLLKTRRKKSTDLPWITDGIRDQIRRRRELFASEGGVCTEAWKEEKRKTSDLIRESKRGYMEVQKGHILAEDANHSFKKHFKNFSRLEKPPPPQFDVRNLSEFENKEDEEVAEELAGYFNRISKKFDPLQPGDVPSCARTNTAASKAWELSTYWFSSYKKF